MNVTTITSENSGTFSTSAVLSSISAGCSGMVISSSFFGSATAGGGFIYAPRRATIKPSDIEKANWPEARETGPGRHIYLVDQPVDVEENQNIVHRLPGDTLTFTYKLTIT